MNLGALTRYVFNRINVPRVNVNADRQPVRTAPVSDPRVKNIITGSMAAGALITLGALNCTLIGKELAPKENDNKPDTALIDAPYSDVNHDVDGGLPEACVLDACPETKPPVDADADILIQPDVVEETDAKINLDADAAEEDALIDVPNDLPQDITPEADSGWICPNWLSYDGSQLPENEGWDAATGALAGKCSSAGGILYCDTSAASTAGYYSINPGFNNAGSVVRLQLQITDLPGATPQSTTGFSLAVADGQRKLQFNFFADKVCEPANFGDCSSMSLNTSAWHEYTLIFKGNDYQLLVNGQLAIDGTGLSLTGAGGENYIRFGAFAPLGGKYNIDYLDYCLSSQ